MDITDVRHFLANIPPFDQMKAEDIHRFASHISVYYCKAQESVDLSSERLLIVRTGLFTLYSDQQQILSKLQPGDFYGYQLLLTGLSDQDSLICDEDGLIYWLNAEAFHQYRHRYKSIDVFFQRLFGRRLHQYKEQQHSSRFTLKINDIVKPRKISIDPKQNVQQAAQLMTQQRVSSLLVEDAQNLVGILTDRDIRSRVMAQGLTADILVNQVMTTEPFSIDLHAYLYQAVQLMSQHNVHHLPVTEHGKCYGMLTATDVIRTQQDHPVFLIGEIHRQNTVADLARCSLQISSLALSLSKQQVPAYEVGHILTTITDALTQRLIYIAQQQLGPAPCVFSWLAFGSQARMDQSLNSDQDNALLLEKEPTADIERYFSALADFVCQGLAQCGVTLCPGNIMASNKALRLSFNGWTKRFQSWVKSPTPDALLKASIFFDLRVIAGSKSLTNALQQDILQRTTNAPLFSYHLAQNALLGSAPLGLFKHFILEHDGKEKKGLDLKKRGISLITDLVRVYALAAGVTEVNTRKRLLALMSLGVIENRYAANLLDAFDLLAQLRWDKHIQDISDHQVATNLLDPTTITGLARHQLKDSFAVITAAQASLKYRFCKEI
jgi:CBS domain-containing protein